ILEACFPRGLRGGDYGDRIRARLPLDNRSACAGHVAKQPRGRGTGLDNKVRRTNDAPAHGTRIARSLESHGGVRLTDDCGRQRSRRDGEATLRSHRDGRRVGQKPHGGELSHCSAPSVSVNASWTNNIWPLASSNNLNAPASSPVRRTAEGSMPNKPA